MSEPGQPDSATVSLEHVLATGVFAGRASRPPDFEAENRALVALAGEMATAPQTVLQKLVDAALDLCRADSAGISILEPGGGPGTLRWHAVAGPFAGKVGGTMAREVSPCGTVLDRDAILLFDRPGRHFTALLAVEPPIVEYLLAPFHSGGRPVGTVWAIAHTAERKFDAEDARLLQSLSRFASAAYQLNASLRDATEARDGVEREVRERTSELNKANEGLKEAQAFAESIVKTVREPLLVLDKVLHVVSANRSFYETFEVEPPEVVGRFVYDLGDGQWDIPRLRTLLESIVPTNSSFDDFEVEHGFEHIGPKTMLLNARRFPSEGEHKLILLAIEDITDRKLTADAVTTSEVRYRRLFEAARDGILLLDPDTRAITDANPFMLELLGYSRGDLVGKELWEIGLLRDERASREAFDELGRTGSIRYEDLPLQSKAGARREVEFVSNIYQEHDRQVIQCNIRDISERKRAEEGLARLGAESERLRRIYETALSNTADFNYVFDIRGRFAYVNAALLALWQRDVADVVGKNFLELGYPPALAERLQQQIQQVVDTRQPLMDETPYTSASGERQHEYIFVPVLGEGGSVEAVAGSTRDITDHKEMEGALRRQAEQLREAGRRKDEFLAVLAHELRNPLAPIRNALQLVRLGSEEPRSQVREAFDIIERQVENLVRLIDDLLDVSRITSGKIQLQKERVDLASVVARAVEGARPLIDARRHALEVRLPDGAVPVEADPVRLAQVLWNLLNNAAKYTPDGGRITLTVERGDDAMVRVRDTGTGIAPEMLPRVFDLFTQMERTLDRAEGGLGIGLTLVRRLTEMHGGTVAAASEGLGQGCEFVVRLPVLPDDAPAAEPVKRDAARRRVAPASGRRVLVVDDNRDSAESLAKLLRLFGNDVRTALDGRLALEVAAAYRPDVVLLDIGLPGMDGLEVCRRLRARSGEVQPLIMAMTGYGQEEDRRLSQEAGFNAHMVKPLDLDALQELLSRPELARRGP